ncbi:DUF6290 family protein [Actinomyces timonensis]|nr:DUF6290 family protein [Actinomyces timonensis]
MPVPKKDPDGLEERIEDEVDLKAWQEARAEYDADPVTVTSDAMARKYA